MKPDEIVAAQNNHELPVGFEVDKYVVEAKIGAGTFGKVYRGIQPLIGKQVAIKVLSRKYSADPNVVSRFVAEARAVNQIRHKNIIDIYSFGQLEDDRYYHVMELLDGVPLDEYLKSKGGRLPLTEIFPIVRGLARALDAAHTSNIAHRDLKPANVFLANDDEGAPFPKLLDFGIAKLLSDEMPRQHHTGTGAAIGTPDYMSPEQCQGPDVDHRTDIYSFGVMCFQLLTGRLPFQGQNVVEVLMKHMTEAPPKPSEVAPDLSPALDAPILQMIAKAPEARPQSLQDAVALLEEAAKAAGYTFGSTGDPVLSSGPIQAPPSNPSNPLVLDTPREGARMATLEATMAPISAKPESPPEPKNARRQIAGLLAVTAIAGAVVTFSLLEPERPAPPPKVVSEPPKAVPPPVIKPVEPEKTPEPTEVAWFIEGSPKGAQILGPDGKQLGTLPGKIELPRSEEPLELTFRYKRYRSETRSVVPSANGALTIKLKKRRVRKTNGSGAATNKERDKDAIEEPGW